MLQPGSLDSSKFSNNTVLCAQYTMNMNAVAKKISYELAKFKLNYKSKTNSIFKII